MSKKRTFTLEFKRQLVEEKLSGLSTAGEICRKHNIARPVFSRWCKSYLNGELREPTKEDVLRDRISELERLVGQLTFENNVLKKTIDLVNSQQKQKDKLSKKTYKFSDPFEGGAKC